MSDFINPLAEENPQDESLSMPSPDNLKKFHFLREEERKQTKEEKKKPEIKKQQTKESLISPTSSDNEPRHRAKIKPSKTIAFDTVEINKNQLDQLSKKKTMNLNESVITESKSNLLLFDNNETEKIENIIPPKPFERKFERQVTVSHIDLSKVDILKLQTRNKELFNPTERELITEEEKFDNFLSPVNDNISQSEDYTKNMTCFLDNTDDNLLENHSEHSHFYKNDYFREDKLYVEDDGVEHKLKISIKDELLYKSRLVNTYLNPKIVSIPKFTKISEKERKCKEILDFKDTTIKQKVRLFYDPYPLLECRRHLYRIASYVNKFCLKIVKNRIFDNLSLGVILLNTLLILISDPNSDTSPADISDSYFLYFYTMEMFLKIFAFGFIMSEGAYLKDLWNILDFCVIIFGWLSFMLTFIVSGSAIKGLSGLRAFRILRPLKTVKSIEGLRNLIVTLLESLMGLGDIVIVLFFFFLIFAIAGVQMWQGLLRRRCMNMNIGYVDQFTDYTTMCTNDDDCKEYSTPGSLYTCVQTMYNPNNDISHFDNTMNALITVFIIATMEGWTDIWNYVSRTFRDSFGINKIIIFFYFHLLLFVGGYYLINLFLAVVMDKFDKVKASKKTERVGKKNKSLFSELLTHTKKKLRENKKKQERTLIEVAIENIRKEYDFIEKNREITPVSYKTIEDMFVLNTLTPDELYHLKLNIVEEAKKVVQECDEKIAVYKKSLEPTAVSEKIQKDYMDDIIKRNNALESRKASNLHPNLKNGKISKKVIQYSIEETLQKLLNDNKKQINEKDSPKMNKDAKTAGAAFISQKKRVSSNLKLHRQMSESDDEQKSLNKSHDDKGVNIENENLSFLSQHSMEVGAAQNNNIKIVDQNNNENNNNNVATNNPNPDTTAKRSYSVCAIRKQPIDPSKGVFNKVTFTKPSNRISEFTSIKREIIKNRKREEKQKRFNVEQYVRQVNPNLLNRKNSYLNMMRHIDVELSSKDETPDITHKTGSHKNKTTSFDVSLYHDDHIMMDSRSELDLSKNANVELSKNVITEIDVDGQKFVDNKNNRLAKKSSYLSESKTLKRNTLALSKGDAFIENPERSTGRRNFGTVINNLKTNALQLRKMSFKLQKTKTLKDDQINLLQNDKAVTMTSQKAVSVEKSLYKFPGFNEAEKIKAMDNLNSKHTDQEKALKLKKSKIDDFMQNYRKYLNYVNNLLEKDFKIKDKFSVDDSKEDVLGEQKPEIKEIAKVSDRDPIKYFNDSKINLRSYQYVPFLNFGLVEEEMLLINHKLLYLTSKIIQTIPAKKKDFGLLKKKKKSSARDSGSTGTFRTSVTSHRGSTFIDDSQKSKTRNSLFGFNHVEFEDNLAVRKANLDDLFKQKDSITFKKFNHIFENDEQILNKRVKKRAQKRDKVEKDYEAKEQIEKIKVFDTETNTNKYKEWSAKDILALDDDEAMYSKWNREMRRLEEFNIILWKENSISRFFQKGRYILYSLSISAQFDFFIIFIVIVNAIIMSLDGNLLDPVVYDQIQVSNYIFNGIFIFEFVVKLFGLGPLIYFSDPFTYLDMMIIGFALLDMATSDDSSSGGGKSSVASQLSFLRVLRVFRIFRVIRLAKVLRKIKAMGDIIRGISRSLDDIRYVLLILVIFILIFQLLGMSLLNSSPLFQSFMSSFYITFQTLTTENWNQTLYQLSLMSRLTVLYLVVWIFIGNYILYNLFVSILLNSFDDFGDKNEDDIEFPNNFPEVFKVYELAEKEYKDRIKSRKRAVGQKTQSIRDDEQLSSDSEEEVNLGKTRFTETSFEGNDNNGSSYVIGQWESINMLFKDNDCENSLFIFSQTNRFRVFCMNLICWKRFDQFIMLMILVSTMRLVLDTFIDGYLVDTIFNMMDIFFTLVFLSEMISKVIALGFILDNGSYLQDNWNRIDFVIVVVSIIDLQGLISKLVGAQSSSSLSFLKVLRLLRTLRPLRFISHNVQLKLIITSLFDSIEPIMSVLAVVFVVYFIFSIIGMNLFYDLYHLCFLKSTNNNSILQAPVPGWADLLVQNKIDSDDIIAVNSFVK
jgi:hypothetical protein